MPLTTLPELRKAAAAVHGAIAAFQTGFVEIMQAVYREGQAAQTPVIVETTPKCWDYNRPVLFGAVLEEMAARNDIPVCLHLDRAGSLKQIERAIGYGYTSVMLEEIPQTWLEEAAGLCAGAGVSLGVHLNPIPYGNRNRSAGELSERLEYFRSLKIEMLGIDLKECLFTYGSGGKIVLDRNAANVVRDCLEKGFFLILQNGNQLSDQAVQAVAAGGFYAVNFGDETGRVYCDGMKEAIRLTPYETDPLIYTSEALNYVRELVRERISLCSFL